MRRRSDRKKTPDISSSPAPTTRRSSRRSRRTASPSPEKSDRDSSADQDENVKAIKSRRRTSSTHSKDHSPAKKGRLELNKIAEENGEDVEDINKDVDMEKSIEEEKVVKSRKLSVDDKKPEKEPLVEEKESDIKEKKVRVTDKHLDDKERTTEIQTPKESNDSEKPVGKDEKSPSKRKRSKEREKSSSGSERTHRKDKESKSRQKSLERETKDENITDPRNSSVEVEANGDKEVELPEQVETETKQSTLDISVKKTDDDKQKTVKKRKWVSRKPSENKIMAISTDSLKSLISDPVHPVPLSDVHLDSSPEIEVLQSESEALHEESDQAQFSKRDHRDSNRKSPEKSRPSKEDLEEGEEDSEEEEGQIEREKPVKTHSSPILYITNLVRPFTIMQLKGLLARTGKIVENGFWIDRIKSKCYVKFDNEE